MQKTKEEKLSSFSSSEYKGACGLLWDGIATARPELAQLFHELRTGFTTFNSDHIFLAQHGDVRKKRIVIFIFHILIQQSWFVRIVFLEEER
jgi:hypothetical protein